MSLGLGLKSIKRLLLTLAVAVVAFSLVAATTPARFSYSNISNHKSGDKSDQKKDKKKEKSKSDDGDNDQANKDKKSAKEENVADATKKTESSSSSKNSKAKRPTGPSAAAMAGALETVTATVETDPVPHGGDAADDPAIWINPNDAAKSTIIGTDKMGGLAVYDLSGKQIQYLSDGKMDNVDLRDGFNLGGQKVAIVTASN